MKVFPNSFMHGFQSYRILKDIGGIELTKQVAHGIARHSRSCNETDRLFNFNQGELTGEYSCFETQVVRLADDIAWVYHDYDDALKAELIGPDDVVQYANRENMPGILNILIREGRYIRAITDIINYNRERNLEPKGYLKNPPQKIKMSPEMEKEWESAYKFVKEYIHNHGNVLRGNGDAKNCIERIFHYYFKSGDEDLTEERKKEFDENLPDDIKNLKKKKGGIYPLTDKRVFCDFISLLTDHQLRRLYFRMLDPRHIRPPNGED